MILLFSNFRSSHQMCSIKKRCSLKFRKIHWKTPVPEFFWIKLQVSGPRFATLFEKRLWHSCFPVNFWEIFKNIFFIEHLRATASEIWFEIQSPWDCVIKLHDNRLFKALLWIKKSFKSIGFDLAKHALVCPPTNPCTGWVDFDCSGSYEIIIDVFTVVIMY